MANYKRRKPRTKGKRCRDTCNFLKGWPRWWDIVYHRRPVRRETARLLSKVLRGDCDDEDLSWPLACNKPHNYYW